MRKVDTERTQAILLQMTYINGFQVKLSLNIQHLFGYLNFKAKKVPFHDTQ